MVELSLRIKISRNISCIQHVLKSLYRCAAFMFSSTSGAAKCSAQMLKRSEGSNVFIFFLTLDTMERGNKTEYKVSTHSLLAALSYHGSGRHECRECGTRLNQHWHYGWCGVHWTSLNMNRREEKDIWCGDALWNPTKFVIHLVWG